MKFTVACIQNCAENDLDENIRRSSELVRQARDRSASLICLPEYFAAIEPNNAAVLANAFTERSHPALTHFRALSKEIGAWILLGSLPIRIGEDKVNNRSFLLDDQGQVVATYNKIHLFDVNLRGNEAYRESATVAPGDQAVVATTPWGNLGLTVCYDVRFAYLYRMLAQAGAHFITVPSAFTRTTGEAHWHVLLRARAIETGCYVFAPAQCGVRSWGRATFGHSLVVDPWGKVLADGGTEEGLVWAEVDPAQVTEAQRRIPSLSHDRNIMEPVVDGSEELTALPPTPQP